MKKYEKVYEKLRELKIAFQVVEHPAAITTEEADKYIEGVEGIRTKSLFLTNDKKTACYLLIMDGAKQLNLNRFKEITQTRRIKFASPETLMKKLGVEAGTVSIFGILNNTEKDVQIYFDSEILDGSRISFHPNDNTKTIFISREDMFKFIENAGYGYKIAEIG